MSYTDIYSSWEYIIIVIVLLLIYIPFFISYFYGTYSPWYESLKRDTDNTWVIAGLWIVATIISYIGLYILWRNPTPETVARNLIIAVLFYIGNVILLAWSVIFYQFQNISTATWITLILFIFEFWVFIYVWNIDRLAAIFLIPLVGMYLYFFYSMVHLAFLNGVLL
jgi:tryptophan-rich sensory protein